MTDLKRQLSDVEQGRGYAREPKIDGQPDPSLQDLVNELSHLATDSDILSANIGASARHLSGNHTDNPSAPKAPDTMTSTPLLWQLRSIIQEIRSNLSEGHCNAAQVASALGR